MSELLQSAVNRARWARDIGVPLAVDPSELAALKERIARLESLVTRLTAPPVPAGPPPSRITQIKRLVATAYSVTLKEMEGPDQTATIVRARQVAMYLLRRTTTLSHRALGGQFGGRDHTTVIHARKQVNERRARDSVFNRQLCELEAKAAEIAP